MNTKKIWAIVPAIIPIFFVGFVLGSFNSNAHAAGKELGIGFVDMQKAVLGTNELKKKLKEFKVEIDREKVVMQAKEKKVQKLFEDLNKQSFVLSEDLKRKRQDEFRQEKRDMERYVQDLNDKFTRREQGIKKDIIKKMLKVIAKLGKDRRYSMIIEKTALFYSAANHDLTSAAVVSYNNTHK